MKGLFNGHFWKFLIGLAVIFVAGFAVFYAFNWYGIPSEERRAEQYLRDLKSSYEADTYGGQTPEETLQLFVDALKREDLELASKYVLPDDREKIKSDLIEAKEANQISAVIQRFETLELSEKEIKEASFIITDSNNVIKYQIWLGKNQNGVWKILEL